MSVDALARPRSKASVLLVDDDDRNLLALEGALASLDADLVSVTSADDALRRILQIDFAVILMDVRMPGMDGISAAMLIRQRPQVIPIIFITGLADSPEDMRRGYEAGAVDYIVKPFDAVMVRSKVSVLVELWLAREHMRQSEREALERERFIGVLAHDLRNPLSAISLAAEVLQTSSVPESAIMGKRIKRSSDRMKRMIEDVLDFARGRLSGGIPITRKPIDVGAVCQQAVDEVREAHPRRSIECQVESPLTCSCDADRVAQAVSNLVANAVQHGTGSIRVEAFGEGGSAVVRVSNEGRPIPPEMVPDLFEPFHGEHSSGHGGLGLGLYIVSEIVRAHHGTIEVTSDDARTTFTMKIPGSLA